jgi:sugar-specific transcriptional regulator TrmB
MPEKEAEVQTLVNLGLTVLQAKVYLALAKFGVSTAGTIAEKAIVARQDVYRVLAGLQEKGLIEKIISNPNQYSPIDLEKGLTNLLQRREHQTTEIKDSIKQIRNNFLCIDKVEADSKKKCQFVWVPQEEMSRQRLLNGTVKAKTNVDYGTDFRSAMGGAEIILGSILKDLKRGIIFRALIDISQVTCRESQAFAVLKKNPNHQVRYVRSEIPVKIQIKDRREVLISIENANSNTDTPYLWSNNPILVQVIQEWFDFRWDNGSKDYPHV